VLWGNFANEKELFFMMVKFSPQLKELPGAVEMAPQPQISEPTKPATMKVPAITMPGASEDDLRSAQAILERELVRPDLGAREAEALREVLFGLRERNSARVASVWREAFAEVRTPTDGLKQAHDHLERYFGKPSVQ